MKPCARIFSRLEHAYARVCTHKLHTHTHTHTHTKVSQDSCVLLQDLWARADKPPEAGPVLIRGASRTVTLVWAPAVPPGPVSQRTHTHTHTHTHAHTGLVVY